MKVRRILGLVVTLCVISFNASSQVRCSNKLIGEMVGQLPDLQLDNGFSGDFELPALCLGKKFVLQRDSLGVINHVGIKLFDREVISKHPTPIYYFIERYLMELLLLPTEEDIARKLRMERVKLTSEVYSLTPYKKGVVNIAKAFSLEHSVYITCNNNRYTVSCMDDRRVLGKISFPVRNELITGFTKLEAENSVYPELLLYHPKAFVPLTNVDMLPYKDSLYCAYEDFYATENIVSTSYYKKVGEEFVPLFSLDNLTESVYNLFNARYDWGIQANVTQNLYGNKRLSYEVPLSKLTEFFRDKRCAIYTGIRKYDKSKVEGVAMMVNMELGYQHILTFTCDKDIFTRPDKHEVKIKMYSYVPIHNISSLFGENN